MQEIKFALIYENEIKNIFLCENYELANQLARASFGDEAFAIETTKYASTIGDKYENGMFYHILEDGTKKKVKYIPSEAENITKLNIALSETQLTLLNTYEQKVQLENRLLELEAKISKLLEVNNEV